ncbi:hypothetical protein [Haloarchaeobius sp. HME9146]|uniref:hypothetical protein n=1 Tax=Haloarchaeobius sp. HME9146 TaxID=2978732 RepID=UPI0021C0DA1A|nr:hypothetical protein [Haloarchaeobius sp. HME9146]MCT9098271.1 hypothetical protein [Haloarchaeobius sp. HME9146]
MDLVFLGRLVVGYGFGLALLYGGVLQTRRAARRQFDKLTFGSFRHVFGPLGLTDNDEILRVFWLAGGPLCSLVGTAYLVGITWLLLP